MRKMAMEHTAAGNALLEAMKVFEEDVDSIEGYGRSVFVGVGRLRTSLLRPSNSLNLRLLKAVRKYALDHYNEEGWNFVFETYTGSEILEVISGAKTEKQAIARIGHIVGILDEQRRGAQNFFREA